MTYFGETTPKNPVEFYLERQGNETRGYFTRYDKVKGAETQRDISEIIVLKQAYTIKGFDESKSCGIYSNEIRFIPNQDFVVKYQGSGDVLAEGKYSEIKDNIKSKGAKLHKVLVCYDVKNDCTVSIPLKGIAYFELNAVLDEVETNKFKLKLGTPKFGEKGVAKFLTAIFEKGSAISESELESAKEISGRIREYDTHMKKIRKQEKEEQVVPSEGVEEGFVDNNPAPAPQ